MVAFDCSRNWTELTQRCVDCFLGGVVFPDDSDEETHTFFFHFGTCINFEILSIVARATFFQKVGVERRFYCTSQLSLSFLLAVSKRQLENLQWHVLHRDGAIIQLEHFRISTMDHECAWRCGTRVKTRSI